MGAEEILKSGDLIIRICPITKKPILCEYEGDGRVLDLHNDTIEEDVKEVMNFLKPYL